MYNNSKPKVVRDFRGQDYVRVLDQTKTGFSYGRNYEIEY